MFFSKIYHFIRIFSLDIVAGALAALAFSSSVMEISLPRSYYTVLGLVVWLIYTADHLMDGAKTRGTSPSETHNFFNTYKIPIILVFVLALVFTFRLVLYRLDLSIIEFGIAPGFAVLIYLLLNRYYEKESKWFFIKELWIAIIYSMAIWGGPLIYAGDVISPYQLLLIVSFGLIILSNVLIYSIFERDLDEKEGNRSLVIDFGLKFSTILVYSSLAISFVLALIAFFFLGGWAMHSLPIVLISSTLLAILIYPKYFARKKLYGKLADLVLFLFLLTLIG